MDATTALLGLSGGWGHLLTTPVTGQVFYQKLAGLDKPLEHVRLILTSTLSVMLLAAAAAGYDYYRHRSPSPWLAAGLGLCLMAALWLKSPFPLLLAGPELPAVAIVGLAWGMVLVCKKTTRDATRQTDHCYLLLWSVLSVALLLRFGLRPRLAHYGFVLAMPAALLFIALCLHHAPRGLAARYGGGRIFRRLALLGLAVSVGFWVVLSGSCYLGKTVPAGYGLDTILTYSDRWEPVMFGMAQAVHTIARHTDPGSTLAVLPEGVMVNYLTRRRDPTPYVSYMPAELAIVGEPAMLAALSGARPDYVLVIARKLEEYGYHRYGLDGFSRSILDWVKREYVIVDQFGLFVTLYKRR